MPQNFFEILYAAWPNGPAPDKSGCGISNKGTKRIDTLSDHSQNSPNLMHPDKIYYIADSIAIKNPDVLQTPGFMGRG